MEIINFSIVIPVHNRAHTLPLCLDSILSQTYPNFELILVDDHSSDDSVKLIKKYQKKDKRIVLFEQPAEKKGAQAARNTGIKNSQYDWIMFNDSDDTWVPNKIEKELNLLKSLNYNSDTVIYSDCILYNPETKEEKYWNITGISPENSYIQLLEQTGPMFQSLLCSKQHLIEINYLDESIPNYQEWDTSIRLAKNGKFYPIKEALFIYYIGANDTMSKCIDKNFIGLVNILMRNKAEFIRELGLKKYKHQLAEKYTCFKEKVDFPLLTQESPIAKAYEDELISYFGRNYTINTKKYLKGSFFMRSIRFIVNLPRKIYHKIVK